MDRVSVESSHNNVITNIGSLTRQFKPAQSRIRGAATGTRVDKKSAKRIRETFGDERDNVTEYPSKRVALTTSVSAHGHSGQHEAQLADWVSPIDVSCRT